MRLFVGKFKRYSREKQFFLKFKEKTHNNERG